MKRKRRTNNFLLVIAEDMISRDFFEIKNSPGLCDTCIFIDEIQLKWVHKDYTYFWQCMGVGNEEKSNE